MTDAELSALYNKIAANGPDRVVITVHGEGVSPWQAKTQYRIQPDIIFIRNDGWSLGAPRYLVDVANKMWQAEWVAEMILVEDHEWRLRRLETEA